MHLALLTGGTSSERPVAIRSTQHLSTWIDETTHTYEIFTFPEDRDRFLQVYTTFDLALPVFHGEYGEDGVIQGFLTVLGIPYTGSRLTDHALCIDKYRTTQLVSTFILDGLCTPRSWRISDRVEMTQSGVTDFILKPNTG